LHATDPQPAYRFGPFALDVAAGRLTREGREIKLRPKVYAVLRLLIENEGRLVSKDALFETVWPGRFASDDSLCRALTDVRAALGEHAGLVATVPKRGYRFDGVQLPKDGCPSADPVPETRYAASGSLSIAYQVVGDGPIDLICVPGWVTHLELGWEAPSLASFYRSLAAFSRLILFDKRGTGLSDRTAGLPTIRQRMDDVRAVMDAAGSHRAAIVGMSEGGGMAISFAAAYPARTRALILFGAFAKRVWSEDYPWAPTCAERELFFDEIAQGWGGPVGIEQIAPSRAADPDFRAWWAAYQRRSASPGAALALARMNTAIDVRALLPKVRAPTLVMHRSGDRDADIGEGRFIAERIAGARFAELPGEDHLFFAGDPGPALDCMRAFLAGLAEMREFKAAARVRAESPRPPRLR
jgi:pimeloyl-ACP methyl ester carboxylesterase/DNA-binding winged helix-turn-helix (wHTH) protein